ncbi:MAG: YVTN family beta-propeller protein [Polaribacter sp.]|jgi:YVTN family beta-propeller protein
MNFKKTVFLVATASFLFASCDNNNDNEPALPRGNYDNGILIANEGAFSGGTGTVNFISDDYAVTEEKIYNKVNNENIGTILQSIGFNNDDAYLISNVGNKIAVADRFSMKKITEITGDLNNPRYIAFASGKGFVTNWGDGSDPEDDYVGVIDLETNIVVSQILVAEGPEQIIANGNFLYVSHKGGFGSGNTVSVINATTNTVVTSISVGDIPDELAIDTSGNVLVSCEGKAETSWNPTEVLGSLVTINTTTNEVSATLNFASGFHPNSMILNEGNIYLATSNSVYKMAETATSIPASAIINTTVYGISVNENKVYITDAKNFQDNGSLKIFDASTSTELQDFTVGLIPGKIYFN